MEAISPQRGQYDSGRFRRAAAFVFALHLLRPRIGHARPLLGLESADTSQERHCQAESVLGALHSRGGVGRRRETNMFQVSDEEKVHQELQHTEIPENLGYSYPFSVSSCRSPRFGAGNVRPPVFPDEQVESVVPAERNEIFLDDPLSLHLRSETVLPDGTFPRQAERDGGLSVDGIGSQCLCRPESSGLYIQSVRGRESLWHHVLRSLHRVLQAPVLGGMARV